MSWRQPHLVVGSYWCSVFVVLLGFVSSGWAQFAIPDVDIVALNPQGIRASIPDISGIKQFAFHGKIGKELRIDGEGVRKGDRWVFEDLEVQLKLNDRINYWVFVQYDDLGYRKDKQNYVVKKLYTISEADSRMPTSRPSSGRPGPQCPASMTIKDGKRACQGRVIFEDRFNTLDTTKWIVEKRLSDDQQEHPFVSYQPSSVIVEQNKLKITPRLQSSVAGFKDKIKTGTLDLRNNCTSTTQEFCLMKAEGANFLPPVVSGRVSSRKSFSFLYGRIDIRAQLPQGDWIYPELYLFPTQPSYGSNGYESGVIRIAFARGNLELGIEGDKLDNRFLSGGVLLDQTCRTNGMIQHPTESEPWGGVYHEYSLIWAPDGLTLLVDGQAYGTVTPPEGGFASYLNEECAGNPGATRWSSSTPLAPFDKEFHIVLGVGVGGISDFPDNVGNKPWSNMSPKAKSHFWKDYGSWLGTWEANKSLYVDSIKVTAL